MYDILVYDDRHDDYIPYRDTDGKRLSFEDWAEAAGRATDLTLATGMRYRVHYRTVRQARRRVR